MSVEINGRNPATRVSVLYRPVRCIQAAKLVTWGKTPRLHSALPFRVLNRVRRRCQLQESGALRGAWDWRWVALEET